MPGKLLLILGLWAAALNAQAANKIIPNLVQTPDFSTLIKMINLCDSPSRYEILFFGSDGERKEFAVVNGELWSGVYDDEVIPAANYFFYLPPASEGKNQGYGEITDDSGGCIALEVLYLQSLPEERIAWEQTVPRKFSESGVAVSFYVSDSCDMAIAFAGKGTGVSLEATDETGKVIGQRELGEVHHTSFMLKDVFSTELGEGESLGLLKINGNVSAVGLLMCDGEISGTRFVHPLPSNGSEISASDLPRSYFYEVVSFQIQTPKK